MRRAWTAFKDLLGVQQFCRMVAPTQLESYTPTWTEGSNEITVPSDGTLTGRFVRNAFMCHLTVDTQTGTGGSFGTGTLSWTIPVVRIGSERVIGSAVIQAGTNTVGVATIETEDGDIIRFRKHGGAYLTGSDLTDNDRIIMTILYPISWRV